jgi:hypothetical protein
MSSLTSGEALSPVQLNYIPWIGWSPRRRRARPVAHMDQPTLAIIGDNPHIGMTVETSLTPSTTSPEKSRRR